jgi:hypothetical protein
MSKLNCNVYIIDTGIIKGASIFKNAVAGDSYAFDDKLGHGTAVASICAKNTDAKLIIYNHSPLGKHNERLVFTALADIEIRIRNAPNEFHIINTSFHDKQTPDSVLGKEIDYWGQLLVNKLGAMWVTSASNNSSGGKEVTDIIIPAGFEWATVVTALGNTNIRIADYSNYGKTVDFCAPGRLNVMGLNKSWSYKTGTSYSAPYLCSQAVQIAQYMADNNINTNPKDMDVYNAMLLLARDKGDKGYDIYYGYGEIDTSKLSILLTAYKPPVVEPVDPVVEEPEKHEDDNNTSGKQFPYIAEYIGATKVNVRTGAGTSFNQIGLLSSGERCIVINEEEGWVEVVLHEKAEILRGWCISTYLKEI